MSVRTGETFVNEVSDILPDIVLLVLVDVLLVYISLRIGIFFAAVVFGLPMIGSKLIPIRRLQRKVTFFISRKINLRIL